MAVAILPRMRPWEKPQRSPGQPLQTLITEICAAAQPANYKVWRWAECQKVAAPCRRNRGVDDGATQRPAAMPEKDARRRMTTSEKVFLRIRVYFKLRPFVSELLFQNFCFRSLGSELWTERGDNGTRGRRDDGMRGRGDEGTTGRRGDGTTGRGDERTAGRGDFTLS